MSLNSVFEGARSAARSLGLITAEKVSSVLNELAHELLVNQEFMITENQKDLGRMNVDDPKYDRLKLSASRLEDIASDLRSVSQLNSPVGGVLSERELPNGLQLKRVRVPLGVVGVIYEARPNVTIDVFSLCFKTGNVAVLKGGSDASFSNEALISIIHGVLEANNIDKNVVVLLPPDRSATEALLNAVNYIDVIIPRGSQHLITYVRDNAKVPVIETGAGIVHTFVDASADLEKSKAIILNAKTRRVSVCNSLDCLLVHKQTINNLAFLVEDLRSSNVVIYADEEAFKQLKGNYPDHLLLPASDEHFGIEFLDYKLAIKTVSDLGEALDHIATYSSKHSEAILSEDEANIDAFLTQVDAAAVYANASTGFTDGGQFGLGAEIGISTQKLHARGPMGLEELTSYKWIVKGNGQVRA
ncbi:glutamate-5-semialdehyde dehydrogenase [Arcticibacter pallidicorallinus]|uniref:Gamma-glutamyl phosphate reductase n=1 Tax=Arcticibacter pallidicorallinus TaxID=1259464 RepID=A0A2T0U348_9SPHI|nr:glutamate-5-semialdehyde dehydrogenase [Arcticibacter pallidicorallinus]PRY52335.1 glutamate-5-semialdehyde dehydrogenase [Arcticibacter pallidicorallinus]